jgi:CRP-like cAMP-binding protein
MHTRAQTCGDNTVIHFQDDPTQSVYFVRRGHVRLSFISEDGTVSLHSIVPPGRSCGEAGALEGLSHTDTAFAAGPTEILTLGLGWIDDDGAAAQELRLAVARLIARRFREHVDFTRALYRSNLAQRLSYSLLRLLDQLGNDIRFRGHPVRCLGPVVTRRDLGAMVRGTRENINKTLRQWQKQGILALEDRHIVVLDRDRLERITLAAD